MIFHGYEPLQPGLDQFTISFLKPVYRSPAKLPAMLFYEMMIHDPDCEHVPVLPDACVEILFELNPGKPVVWLGGSPLHTRTIRFRAGVRYFGIRLLPEHGIRLPDELIVGETVPSSYFSKQEALLERLLQAGSLEHCIRVFESFVRSEQFTIREVPDYILHAVRQSCEAGGNLEVRHLAEETGYSIQHFRKKFEQYTGMPPKLFNRIIRFQNALNRILFHSASPLDAAAELGYCDQAHLIKEFRDFHRMTPMQVRNTFGQQKRAHR